MKLSGKGRVIVGADDHRAYGGRLRETLSTVLDGTEPRHQDDAGALFRLLDASGAACSALPVREGGLLGIGWQTRVGRVGHLRTARDRQDDLCAGVGLVTGVGDLLGDGACRLV